MHREPRRPGDGNIEHVPPTELRAIVYATAKAVFGSPRLVVETARKVSVSLWDIDDGSIGDGVEIIC